MLPALLVLAAIAPAAAAGHAGAEGGQVEAQGQHKAGQVGVRVWGRGICGVWGGGSGRGIDVWNVWFRGVASGRLGGCSGGREQRYREIDGERREEIDGGIEIRYRD